MLVLPKMYWIKTEDLQAKALCFDIITMTHLWYYSMFLSL